MEQAQSKTKENLMRAFAGESQARNRYTIAAAQAKKEKLHVLEAVFTFTADQEREHAELFYKFLADAAGETIEIEGGYPVDASPSLAVLLRAAQHNEYEEYETVYPAFGETAEAEGFPEIAALFRRIAEIEKLHGDRFGVLAELLETNRLFISDAECGWVCLNCGHFEKAKEAPAVCPVCKHPQGFFIRAEMLPFTNV